MAGVALDLNSLVWIALSVVLLLGVVVAAVAIARARTRALESERREELPAAPPAPTVEPDAAASTAAPTAPPTAPAAPEAPEAPTTRLARLRRRLAGSSNVLAQALLGLLASDRIDADTWDDFEATLIGSDLGVGPTTKLVASLRRELAVDGVNDPARARAVLRRELVKLVDPTLDRGLRDTGAGGLPAVILVVGVNGTGKTTTIGKLARLLVAEGKTVVLGAADTFRAAAADQLQTWGQRVGVRTVRSERDGADPAAVAFEAVKEANAEGADVVLIDTAGRLHNKANLMAELTKVKRVVEKQSPIDEVLLVLDATTGQNGLVQAEVFGEAVNVTGIVLTKLDGTAKGGIVVGVQRKLGVPVKLIGLGEGPDDLAPFDPEAFVDAILG